MIFVTVGHQTPFDRLLKLVDRWLEHRDNQEIFGQIGNAVYEPENFAHTRWLTPIQFEHRLDTCSAVVAHAGTGTIIQALIRGKPLLVLPRSAENQETRNDHQFGTARHFQSRGILLVAYSDDEFLSRLDEVESFVPDERISPYASDQLLARLAAFVS